MKVSKYNFILKEDDGAIIAFNGISSALCIFDDRSYELYKKLASEEEKDKVDLTDPEIASFVKGMRRNGYFLADEIDEVQGIRGIIKNIVSNDNVLGLTIAPTMDCNFNCPYCYEEGKNPGAMTRQTEQSILRHIEDFISERAEPSVNVTWYGGEPTLALDSVYRLSEGIMELAAKHGSVSFQSDMVTNGYLLDRRTAEELRKHCLRSIQFTIDGYPEHHNNKRPLKNGGETFDTIFKNLKDIVAIIEDITVRINLDSDNINEFDKLLEILEQADLIDKVLLFPCRINNEVKACQSSSESAISVPEFSKEQVKLYRKMIEKNAKVDYYPWPHAYTCCAISKNSILIAPNGDIYKCWNTIGDKRECLGNISNISAFDKTNNKWAKYEPITDEICVQCNILPICMSNCAYLKLGVDSQTKPEERCSEWKYKVEDLIRLKYLEYKLKKMPGREKNKL